MSKCIGSFILAGLLAIATAWGAEQSPETAQAASVSEIVQAVHGATGYAIKDIEVNTADHQVIVRIINSPLNGKKPTAREKEADKISGAVAKVIRTKAGFGEVQVIHVDYVKREANDSIHFHSIDAIDFRKDSNGEYRHHIT